MRSVLFLGLFLVVVVGKASVVFDNYDPDLLPYCAAPNLCEEVTCEETASNNATTAELVGAYRYATEGVEGWMHFHQDILCACNRVPQNVTYWADSRPLRIVADALCTIPRTSASLRVETPTPSCFDRGVGKETEIEWMGCHEYCNEVVFVDLLEELCDKDLPFSELGVASTHPTSSSQFYCECRYGNATLKVCHDPPKDDSPETVQPTVLHDGTESEDESGAFAGNQFWMAVAMAIAATAEIAGF